MNYVHFAYVIFGYCHKTSWDNTDLEHNHILHVADLEHNHILHVAVVGLLLSTFDYNDDLTHIERFKLTIRIKLKIVFDFILYEFI